MKMSRSFLLMIVLAMTMMMGCKGCEEVPCVNDESAVTECHSSPGYYWDYERCDCVRD